MVGLADCTGENSALHHNVTPATQSDPQATFECLIEQIVNAPDRIKGKDKEILRWEVVEELARRVRVARKATQPAKTQMQQDLAEVKETLNKIESTQKQQSATLTKLSPAAARGVWASVAAAGIPQSFNIKLNRATPPLRKTRELMIRIQDKKEAQRVLAKPIDQILRTISDKHSTQRDQIVSIRRLPSGDIALHAASAEARLELEKKADWAKEIAGSARVIRKTYAVLAHGIRTSLDINNAEAAIARLQKENERLHPGLEILRLAWPKKVMGSGKTYSSLIIEVSEETMANRLLEQGILEGYSECACEYFEKRSRVIQCFQCFGFGHVGRGCTKSPACHKCGEKHKAEDCFTGEECSYCTNCKQAGHKPWQRTCPKWIREKKTAGEILKACPYRYQEPSKERSPSSQTQSFASSQRNSSADGGVLVDDGDGFVEILGGKRRKTGENPTGPRRGRPPGSTNANRAKAADAYNVHKRLNPVQVSFLCDETIKEFDIVAIQEQGRTDNSSETYNPSSSKFHLVNNTSITSRACIYVNKAIDKNTWRVERQDLDICTIRLEKLSDTGTKQAVYIHSVYNPSPISQTSMNSPSTLPILQQALGVDGEHLVLGDFNLHHPHWTGPRGFSRHAAADQLIEIMNSAQLDLLLPPGTVTRDIRNEKTTIDLSFGSLWVTNRLVYCGARVDLHQGSDHLPIETVLNLCTIDTPQVERRLWKKTNQELLNTTLQALLPSPRPLSDIQAIDSYTNEIQLAIQKAIDVSVPWARPSDMAQEFWTVECTEARDNSRRSRNEWKSQNTEESWKRYCEATDEKGKIIRKAKAAAFRNAMHEASQNDSMTWRLARWARLRSNVPKELPQFPPLKRQHDDTLANIFEEKAEILHTKFFPKPPDADLSDIEGTQYPTAIETEIGITRDEISQAILGPRPDKAPGISQITNRVLQAGLGKLLPSLECLFNACFDQGYHPRLFKKANTIVLRKSRKANYSDAKSYRPIALLETVGKALESIIARRLTNLAERHNLLPVSQMGARRKRSTETAIELLTEQVHTIWGCGTDYVASILSLDVAGAFDNVSHRRLIHNLRKRRIPDRIIDWVTSFLSDRQSCLTFDGKSSDMRDTHAGIPQGSPISPILFLFFNADLVEICARQGLAASQIGFVDDVNILTYSRSTRTNCRTLRKVHDDCMQWARTHRASFAPEKYELIHLSRTPQNFNMRETLPIDEQTVISPSASIRILGFQVDTKLSWGAHLRYVEARNATQMLSMYRLGASTWGATFAKARQIYTSVVRPALTYGAPIWHKRNSKEALSRRERRLEILQNAALRSASGAFKLVNTQTLEAETYVPPIHVFLNKIQDRATLRQREDGRTEEINRACELIRAKLTPIWPRGGYKPNPGEIKGKILDSVMRKGREIAASRQADQSRRRNVSRPSLENLRAITVYHQHHWKTRWETYRSRILDTHRTPAQASLLAKSTLKLRAGLHKAESTLATHIRTERIGLNAYLYRRKVPGIDSPACRCGWGNQTAKHIIMHCPDWTDQRKKLYEAVETRDYGKIVSTSKGLKAASRLLMETGLLGQFSLAKTLLYGEV